MSKSNWRQSKILITGAGGFIGSNLSQHLSDLGVDIVTTDRTDNVDIKCDLLNQVDTKDLFDKVKPDTIFHLAAKVGGILANVTQKADFYLDNTLINTNVLAEVQRRGIKQVFAMGAGCAYPKKLEDEDLNEPDFFDGIPEVTNDSYAYSKRNMLVHLQALAEDPTFQYIYFVPSNIYGPHDNYHPDHSHVVAGLINRFIQAKQDNSPDIKIWGDGSAKRDLLFVEDLIKAMILTCDNKANAGMINIATGKLTSVNNLARSIARISKYTGTIGTDMSYPEGQKHRTFNIDQITKLGWSPASTVEEGLSATIAWYQKNIYKADSVLTT